jgi:hypothetical protein
MLESTTALPSGGAGTAYLPHGSIDYDVDLPLVARTALASNLRDDQSHRQRPGEEPLNQRRLIRRGQSLRAAEQRGAF